MDEEYLEAHRNRPKDQPVDRLERDILPPPLEAAEAEYFADMAFDDRLLAMTDLESPLTTVVFDYETNGTQEGMAAQYFTPNTYRPREIEIDDDSSEYIQEPIFKYHLSGKLQRHPNRLFAQILVEPDDILATSSVCIESDPTQPDVFHISKLDNQVMVDTISSADLFTLLLQLAGSAKKDADATHKSLAEKGLNTPAVYQANIEAAWLQLGQQLGGTVTRSHEFEHAVKNPANEDFPETIHLLRREVEKPEVTQMHLTLTHVTEMPSLASVNSYQLRLVFEQARAEKEADHLIQSVDDGPRLVSISAYHNPNGKNLEPLDLDNITIKELFVDWFDQIISE